MLENGMENNTIKLIQPFYYSNSRTERTKIIGIKGCRLVEIKGEKYLELPLSNGLLFIPAEGLIQIES